MHFLILENGDVINMNEVLYVHLSKTEECAYVYVNNLRHASDDYHDVIGAKRVRITLKDYDKFISIVK